MAGDEKDEERTDRDHARSLEAHWKVAEAGARDAEGPEDAARDSDENEGAQEEDETG